MGERSYSIGRALGRHWLLVALLGAGLLVYLWVKTPTPEIPPIPPTAEQLAWRTEKLAERKIAEEKLYAKCNAGAKDLKKEADAEIKAGKPASALSIVKACDGQPIEPANRALLDATVVAAKKADQAAISKAVAAQKARAKREGVSIGMTPEEVLASSWGKPNKINRTTGANYEHEQWVYGGGYLYFKNGILSTIQN